MALTVLLGGARSGKSRLALELAAASGAPVTFVATGEPGDDEMAERIERHRAERPGDWTTVEEPYAIEEALARIDPESTVVLDCLTLWAANALERDGCPGPVLDAAARTALLAAGRSGLTVAISNEVGLGIVPVNELARAFRDLLGEVNRIWVDASKDAHFVIAGRSLPLERIAP